MARGRDGLGFWIFFVALLLRLGWIVVVSLRRGVELEFPDESLHWQLANNLVSSGSLISDDGRYAARMPLYPLFLATFAWLGSNGIVLARLAQALLGAVTAWLVYRLGLRTGTQRTGLLAGGLVAVDPYAIFFAGLLLTEVPFTLIAVALVSALAALPRGRRAAPRAAMVGVAVVGGLAILMRPSAAGWIVLVWLLAAWRAPTRGRALGRVVVGALGALLLLAPWALRNQAVLGDPAWLSTNGGVTLYDARGPQATGASDQRFLQQLPELDELGEVERDERLGELAWQQMTRDPRRVAALAWEKTLRTWSLRPNHGPYRDSWLAWLSVAFMVPVLLLALAGTARGGSLYGPAGARWRWLLTLCWAPIIYFTLVHAIYVGSLRYRVPLMPFVEIAAAGVLAGADRRSAGVYQTLPTPPGRGR